MVTPPPQEQTSSSKTDQLELGTLDNKRIGVDGDLERNLREVRMKHQLIEDKALRNRLRHQAIIDLERERQDADRKAREDSTPSPSSRSRSRSRRRSSGTQSLPTRVPRLTAAQARAQAALADRAAEVARRRDQLAALETGSNR